MNMPMPGAPAPAQPRPAPAMAAPGMQPQAAPQAAPAPGGIAGLPPELQRHVDPKNPVQSLLLQRLDALSEEESVALVEGMEPPAAMALKKLLPEIGFLIDFLLSQGGAGGGAPMGGAPAPMGGPPAMPQQPGAPQRSRLASI